MKEFYDLLLERREALEEKKKALLRPLLDYLSSLELLHTQFFQERRPELKEKEIRAIFRNTLPGQFQTHLLKKARELIVFGFNSAR